MGAEYMNLKNDSTPPFFSIAIPTKNRSTQLVRTVSSVLAQSFHNFEIIVSHNNSTDDTKEALLQFEGDDRVKVIHQDKSISMRDNFMVTYEECSGQYFAWMSDDDWMCRADFLQQVADKIEIYSDISLIYSGRQCVDKHTGGLSLKSFGNAQYYSNLKDWILRDEEKMILNISGVLMKRSTLDLYRHIFFHDNVGAGWGVDYLIYSLVMSSGGAYGIKDVCVSMTINTKDNAVSNHGPVEIIDSSRNTKDELINLARERVHQDDFPSVVKKIQELFGDRVFLTLFIKDQIFSPTGSLRGVLAAIKVIVLLLWIFSGM